MQMCRDIEIRYLPGRIKRIMPPTWDVVKSIHVVSFLWVDRSIGSLKVNIKDLIGCLIWLKDYAAYMEFGIKRGQEIAVPNVRRAGQKPMTLSTAIKRVTGSTHLHNGRR